jgi:hypothetical protein
MRLKTLCVFLLAFNFATKGQVTMQTGAPSINIPLIEYADANSKLKLNISLSYTGGNGIKVNEKSSEVGLGWTLNAGGLIQRIKAGEPDDQIHIEVPNQIPNTIANPIHIPAGIFNQPTSFNNPSPIYNPNASSIFNLAWNPTYHSNDIEHVYYDPNVHFDTEHDKFIYSIEGETGSFILGKAYPHVALKEDISDSKISVINEIPSGINAGSIKGFTIINADGIKYTYENKLLTAIVNYKKVLYSRYGSVYGTLMWHVRYPPYGYFTRNQYVIPSWNTLEEHQFEIAAPFATPYKIANAWYISKIENPQTGEKIMFNYYQQSFTENLEILGATTVTGVDRNDGGQDYTRTLSISESYQDELLPILYSIDLPNGKKVQFNYLNQRKDATGKASLDEILFYNANELQYKYSFKHGYFFENSILEENNLPATIRRNDIALALKSITQIGRDGTSEPATNFDYYTGVVGSSTLKFPTRNSFSQDKWGYYNAVSNGVNVYPGQSYEDKISLIGLESYLINDGVTRAPSSDNEIIQIGLIKSMSNKYGGKTTFTYNTNKAVYNNAEVLSGGVKVFKVANLKSPTEYSELKYDYVGASGLSSADNFEPPVSQMISDGLSVKPNYPVYNYFTNSAPNAISQAQTIISKSSSILSLAKTTNSLIKSLGLNLKIAPILANLGYLTLFWQALSWTGRLDNVAYTTLHYQSVTNSTSIVGANNYLTPNYSAVTEHKYGNDANNNIAYEGYTKYEFVSAFDRPLIRPILNYPYPSVQRKLSSFYNMPKTINKYDINDNLLNSKTFEYSLDNPALNFTQNYSSVKFGPTWILTSPDHPNGPSGGQFYYFYSGYATQGDRFKISSYGYYSGKSLLTKTIEKQYKGNNFLETKTDYTYVPNSHLQRSASTTDSKGDITESKLFYSFDYDSPIEKKLVTNNIITPITTELWKTKAGGTIPKLLSSTATQFDYTPNGDLMPIKSYTFKANEPVAHNLFPPFNPNNIIRDPNLITLDNQIIYDNYGNVIQQITSPNNTISSVIYSTDKLPIATVTNANRSDIACTSFETNSELDGGFIFYQDDVVYTGQPPFYCTTGLTPTGKRCVEFSNPNDQIYSTITISKESILSFWATKKLIVNNTVSNMPSLIGPTINEWTYYEYNIPAGTTTVFINGIGKLDEVRLYPKNAKMATTTYDLANNKLDDCDINNRITYYETDKLGRPLRVMDEKRNTIKTFEYHFKN